MRLKVVSFNILHGGEIGEGVFTFLKDQNADIMLLQEVYDGHESSYPRHLRTTEVLRELFPQYDSFYSPELLHITQWGKVDFGNMILSKFPLKDTSVTFFDDPYGEFGKMEDGDYSHYPKNMQVATASIDNRSLTLVNLHGIWGFNGNDNERRLNMSKKIISVIEGKELVIVAGDFNTSPNTKSIQNIEEHLTNVFKNELKSTFNMRRKTDPGYAVAVVDHMFVSKSMKVIDHLCPDVDFSDHLPLVATLEL